MKIINGENKKSFPKDNFIYDDIKIFTYFKLFFKSGNNLRIRGGFLFYMFHRFFLFLL